MSKITRFIRVTLIIALAIYIFDKVRMFSFGYQTTWQVERELPAFLVYYLYSVVIGFVNFKLVSWLNIRFPWAIEPKKRAIYGVFGAVVASMIAIIFLRIFTALVIEQKAWTEFIANEKVFYYYFSLLISIFVVLIFYVIYFYKAITKKAITEHKTIAKTEIAKYESLKNQLDPHFLFNSLNVLTSLIEENPKQAERFTTKLSKVYRYVLEQKEKTLVPLQEELDFAKVYMELLKMRFENAIQFEIPDNLANPNYKIVPLSLQLLLENMIKHNALSEENPLQVTIRINDGELLVCNNTNPKQILKKGTGIGLQNIKERYALITDKQVQITKTKENFIVRLPLLTQKTKIMKTIDNNTEIRYNRAKDKVEKMKGFYAHLVSYIGVNTFLVFLNFYTGWEHKWFLYPLLGWGIGLVFNYFEAFGHYPFLNKDWEEKKIKELMDEESDKHKEMWK